MTLRFWFSAALLIYSIGLIESTAKCRSVDYSIPGMFLKGHTFKTVQANFAAECDMICEQEARCQSYNVIIGKNICELNSRTKEARPEEFMPDVLRFYKRRTYNRAPIGSIPELPAESCSEIKQTEGNQMANAEYWIYADKNTEQTILATCEGVWQKISKKPVCFGAKNNKYGAFKMTKTGRVKSMKLVRRSGSIRCDLITSASYWGCILSYPKNSLMTIITNANQQALFPPFNKLKETKPLALCKKKHFYALKLVGHKSKNLVYDNLASPLPLARNQELRIWYGQDWIGCLEFDNSGATCVDVYAWYL